MGYIIIASVLVLVILGGAAYGLVARRISGGLVAGGALVLLVVVTLFSSFTAVEARSVAIETSFGKYVDTLPSGNSWIAPWAETEQFDTTVQPVDLADDDNPAGGKIQVNYLNGGGGWINANVRWSIDENNVNKLWEKHRTFELAVNNLIRPAAVTSIVNAANDLTALDARNDQARVAEKAKTIMEGLVGQYGVKVESVSILGTPLDDKTQAAINTSIAVQQELANAETLRQKALKDAETAKVIQDSKSASPELNQRACLDISRQWNVANSGPLPATWNCGLDTANTGVNVQVK